MKFQDINNQIGKKIMKDKLVDEKILNGEQ